MFFRDVRVPVANVVGQVNQGWDVAIGTLMHERGTFGAGLQITYQRNIGPADRAVARRCERDGRPAAEDPVIRQKLAQCYAEVEIMRANQMRAFSRISATGVPGPGGIDPEDFLERTEPAPPAGRAGTARPVRPARRPATPARSITARGRTATCARAATRSKPARRKSSATSSATSCSACREATSQRDPRCNSD